MVLWLDLTTAKPTIAIKFAKHGFTLLLATIVNPLRIVITWSFKFHVLLINLMVIFIPLISLCLQEKNDERITFKYTTRLCKLMMNILSFLTGHQKVSLRFFSFGSLLNAFWNECINWFHWIFLLVWFM